jgi:phosphatidylglycerophosphate synthase
MSAIWEWIKKGYLRLIDPVAEALAARGVDPNTLTTIGTLCTVAAGVAFAFGHISIGGWILSVTAAFDVIDGLVARRTGRETAFGAFYDSSLDRISDGAILGGLTVFWAVEGPRHSIAMVVVCLLAIVGSFLTSYTRARADGLGLDAKVGLIQRPERVVLLAAPQALFGLALDGLVLKTIVVFLTVTAWITVVQRVAFVRRATATGASRARPANASGGSPIAAPGAPE